MKTFIQLFIAIVMMAGFTTKGMAQTSDYSVNWSDTSTYKVTCGKVVPAQWSVKNQTCEMTTPHFRAAAAAGCKVNFNFRVNQSGNGETSDLCQVYHQIDNREWVLDTIITGGAGSPYVRSISDSVYLDYGHFVQFKIRMSTNSQTEFWAILQGDMSVSDGNPTVNNLSIWSGEPPPPPPPPQDLPVELLMFTGMVINGAVELNWATASETNNDYFTIEKSKDAINFEIVAFAAGAGNSNTVLNYSTKDNEPFSGVTYYRLKQTDFDGKFTYSNIVPVNYFNENNTSIIWWQEGSSLNLNIQSSCEGESNIDIYDYSGKLALNKNISLSGMQMNTTLNTDILKTGFYIIRLTVGSEQKTIKILIH